MTEPWHAAVKAALADHVEPEDWTAEWGSLVGEGTHDDCDAVWTADLDGERVGLVMGCLEVRSDVHNDDYGLAVRRLLGAVRGWERAE